MITDIIPSRSKTLDLSTDRQRRDINISAYYIFFSRWHEIHDDSQYHADLKWHTYNYGVSIKFTKIECQEEISCPFNLNFKLL